MHLKAVVLQRARQKRPSEALVRFNQQLACRQNRSQPSRLTPTVARQSSAVETDSVRDADEDGRRVSQSPISGDDG